MKFEFDLGHEYTRKEIKHLINHPVPNNIGGVWATGYTFFEDCFFIFANVGVPGRTGHNYSNQLLGDSLYWYSKNRDSIHTSTIKRLLSGDFEVYIFTRKNSNNVKFEFNGLGFVKDFEDTKPFHIVWGFTENTDQELTKTNIKFIEGIKSKITVNKFERNREARELCLDSYGYNCVVCDFNFEDKYGEIGKEYIHVHHLVEISAIGKEYEVDPIKDLRPVCPNCHAMLHKRKPAFTIEELRVKMSRI